MAAEIAADTELLARDIEEMRSILDNTRAQLKKISDEMEAFSTKWQGIAKISFMIRFRNDCNNTEKLFDAAEKFIDAMQYAKEQYASCAFEVSELIHTIHIE